MGESCFEVIYEKKGSLWLAFFLFLNDGQSVSDEKYTEVSQSCGEVTSDPHRERPRKRMYVKFSTNTHKKREQRSATMTYEWLKGDLDIWDERPTYDDQELWRQARDWRQKNVEVYDTFTGREKDVFVDVEKRDLKRREKARIFEVLERRRNRKKTLIKRV